LKINVKNIYALYIILINYIILKNKLYIYIYIYFLWICDIDISLYNGNILIFVNTQYVHRRIIYSI